MKTEQAQIQNELKSLMTDNLLKAEKVVAWAAKHRKSALYAQFEWDDTKAANDHRVHQARQIIARFKVTVLPNDDTPFRMFVSLTSDRKNGGGYRLTDVVLNDEVHRSQAVIDAEKDAAIFAQKYAYLKEAASMIAAYVRDLKPAAEAARKVIADKERRDSRPYA